MSDNMGSGSPLPQHAAYTYFPVEWKHWVWISLTGLCVVKRKINGGKVILYPVHG